MKINSKDINKYFTVDTWEFLANKSEMHFTESNGNDLQEVLETIEKQVAETGQEMYIAQLIRVVSPKLPIETETTVVK